MSLDGSDSEEQGDGFSSGYAREHFEADFVGNQGTKVCCAGQLKAKLAKLKRELLTPTGGGGGGGGEHTHRME